jgi:DNA replication protein DnaC
MRENLLELYQRVPRLFALLALGRGDGRYAKFMRQLGRVDLLILDDWRPEPLLPDQQRDLLEIIEDRYNAGLPRRHHLDAITSERWTASDQNRWTPSVR